MHLILQQKKANDYVVATGVEKSVKDFVNSVAKNLKIKIKLLIIKSKEAKTGQAPCQDNENTCKRMIKGYKA